MTKRERDLLALRFQAIDAELQALADGRVVDGDPAVIEGALMAEQDYIEYRLGADYFDRHNAK